MQHRLRLLAVLLAVLVLSLVVLAGCSDDRIPGPSVSIGA